MPNFDGTTLTITLDSGITEIDVQDDIYEPWKDWMLATTVNRKYPQAFRSDGGNPLSSVLNQGSYFFLNNTAGWRIKPPEENITIYLTGNLVVEDTALEAFVPTNGSYTASIIGLQPITQGVAEESLANAVWNKPTTENIISGSFGEMVGKKLLTLAKYLGLK